MIVYPINDSPVGLDNIISDYEKMDLITANRLRLGRNNDRSAAAAMKASGNTLMAVDFY